MSAEKDITTPQQRYTVELECVVSLEVLAMDLDEACEKAKDEARVDGVAPVKVVYAALSSHS